MAEEKTKLDNMNPDMTDDMIVMNVLMHTVKGINVVSTAPAFEPTTDSY